MENKFKYFYSVNLLDEQLLIVGFDSNILETNLKIETREHFKEVFHSLKELYIEDNIKHIQLISLNEL